MLKPALIFQDHMTLQREKPVAIWGTAAPGAAVTVTVQGASYTAEADADGNWRVAVGPLAVSFSEEVRVSDGAETVTFSDVQVGDVFLAAGQSNMEFHMRYDADFAEEKTVCANDHIRFFDYPEVSYVGQLEDADYGKNFGFWRKAAPDDLQWFSAPAYYCAKTLQKRYGIPVGIVGCNWGGTPACAWMNEASIREGGGEAFLEDYRKAVETLDVDAYNKQFASIEANFHTDPFASPFSVKLMEGKTLVEIFQEVFGFTPTPEQIEAGWQPPAMGPKSENRPGGLYESMLCQVAPYGLKGVLYYQGESDGDSHPEAYATLFPALIRGFRRLWGEELPFLFVQLAPFGQWLAISGKPYGIIRDAQQHTADTVPGTGMAVITDIGMELDIHPKKKKPVGERLALLAENRIYGEDVLCEAPTLCAVEAEEGCVRLRFENAGDGLYLADHTPDGAATDPHRLEGLRLFIDDTEVPANGLQAEAAGDAVTLTSPAIRKGAVRAEIGIGDWFRVNLYNSAGLPARPARAAAKA